MPGALREANAMPRITLSRTAFVSCSVESAMGRKTRVEVQLVFLDLHGEVSADIWRLVEPNNTRCILGNVWM